MEQQKTGRIGLFGFGVVGEGLYRVLQETSSLHMQIKKVCIQDAGKQRQAPASLFTTHRSELLDDPEIDTIVEVINESKAAFEIVSAALKNGKNVVSAIKKMIAEHLPELLVLQQQTGRSFLYEAAACASIPIIRNLEEYYDNDGLHSLRAIVNGSTNFILTRMFDEDLSFKEALLLAQRLGFAEKEPGLDIRGVDAAHKWSLLLAHAFGIMEKYNNLVYNGIDGITREDAQLAARSNYQLKLVAQAKRLADGRIAAFVLPQFVRTDDPLAFVKNEFNGVVIESHFADRQFLYGKGAGSLPTASAILSDLSALRYGYKYNYRKLMSGLAGELTHDFYLRVYLSFPDKKWIDQERFEWIEEWHDSLDRSYLTGVLHIRELAQTDWWKQNGLSLILLPEAVEEEGQLTRQKKESLAPAGLD